ncbi:MAG: ferredoxin-type protein NapG [Thermodesulfovibrionales bacterium]
MSERREFLVKGIRGIGLAVMGGLAWTGIMDGKKAYPLILRPPAALPEEEFLVKCLKCGQCVEACPYDSLVLASPGDERPIGTPYYIPRKRPCFMCKDIPCVKACPSGALDPELVTERDEKGMERLSINRSKMGIAAIDRESCIAYWGIQCDACYRKCPRMDKALSIEYIKNDRTGKHTIMAPVVHSDACTGCGLCESVCITKKASIFVLPRKVAMGETGGHYQKGWEKLAEEPAMVPEEAPTVTPRSSRNPMDYLNEGL